MAQLTGSFDTQSGASIYTVPEIEFLSETDGHGTSKTYYISNFDGCILPSTSDVIAIRVMINMICPTDTHGAYGKPSDSPCAIVSSERHTRVDIRVRYEDVLLNMKNLIEVLESCCLIDCAS